MSPRSAIASHVVALTILSSLAAGCATKEPTLPPAHLASLADHPLSRAECCDLAFASAPTAAAWDARLLRANAALAKARTIPNPTVLLEWEDLGLDHGPDAVPSQKTQSLLLSLADLVAMPWRIDAAQFDLEAERAHVASERLALAKEVSHSYDELLTLREKIALLHEAVEIAEREQSAIGEFARLGQLSRIASERAQAEVHDAAAEEAAAVIVARTAEIRFAFALGFDRPLPLALTDSLSTAEDSGMDLESLLREAATSRPEIAEALAKYKATLERERFADFRIELLPTIGVGHRRQHTTTSEVASIEVGLPLFDQGQNAVNEASAELLDAAVDLRRVAQGISSEVAVAHDALAASTEFLHTHAAPLARLRESLRDGTEKLFRAGEATIDDWITTRRDEVKARLALVEARAAAASARVDLEAALGRLAPLPSTPPVSEPGK